MDYESNKWVPSSKSFKSRRNKKLRKQIKRNFGTFEVKPASAKPNARNPKTNEVIYVPPHKKIHFRPGKIIKNELSKEYILK